MPLYFKSLCSSSDGNCLSMWTEKTSIIIDCGLGSMKRTRKTLTKHTNINKIDSVVLTHMHTDHISYYPLRALEEIGCTIRVHQKCLDQLREKHFNGYNFGALNIEPFSDDGFNIGDIYLAPFEVSHNPLFPTYGFVIRNDDVKAVIVTDFNQWENIVDYFLEADFIFVESNHDLELLRMYYNPNSRYHMPNPETAMLLHSVRKHSYKPPHTVMLGHISSQRNETNIALAEVKNIFHKNNTKIDFRLLAAPLRKASETVEIKYKKSFQKA